MSWYQNLHPSQTYAAECVPLLRQDLESPVWRFQMMSPAVVFCEMLVHLPPKRRNAELKGDICHRLPQDVAFWTFYAAEKLNFYRLQVLLRVCLGYAWSIRSMQWLPGSGLTRAESLHSSTQGHDPLQPFSTLGSCILQGKTARLGYFCQKLVRPQVPASEEPTNSDFSDLQSYHSTEMRVADHFRGSRLSLEWCVVPAIAIRVMSILHVEVMLDLLWCLLAFIGPRQETYSLEKRIQNMGLSENVVTPIPTDDKNLFLLFLFFLLSYYCCY